MADEEVARRIDEALNKILTTTDQSGNMRKEMKKNMYENVSILRNLFVKMQATLEETIRQKPNRMGSPSYEREIRFLHS